LPRGAQFALQKTSVRKAAQLRLITPIPKLKSGVYFRHAR
jgi:hypothetical protein